MILENEFLKVHRLRIVHKNDHPFWKNMGFCYQISRLRLSSIAQATDVLQSFATKSVKATKVSKLSHLFISRPKTDLSALFKPDEVSKFFNQAAFETSVPMSSLNSMQSACPSKFPDISHSDAKDVPTDERPSKR